MSVEQAELSLKSFVFVLKVLNVLRLDVLGYIILNSFDLGAEL